MAGSKVIWISVTILSIYFFFNKIRWTLRERWFMRHRNCKKLKKAPQRDPFFGIDIFIESEKAIREKRFLQFLATTFETQGSTFQWSLMGDNLIFTNEPKNIQSLLATSFTDFDVGETRKKVTKPFWGVGIFNSDGSFWAHSRALVRPNFTRDLVSDISTYATHVNNLISRVPADGYSFDIQDLFFRLTLDTATEHLFGESTHSLQPNVSASVANFVWAFEHAQRTIHRRIRMGKFAKLDRDPDFDRACASAHRYVEPFIERAIARQQSLSAINGQANSMHRAKQDSDGNTRYYLLDELVKSEKDPEKIRGHVMNILVAGRDTTASLLSSLFFTLAQRPDVYSQLQEEVAYLKGRSPTYEDIKEMKYLNYVIKEALRMYSVVPLNTRVANKDTTLPLGGGPDGQSPIYVRQGQTVVYQVYSLHRRVDLWGPDAEEFRPERWYDVRPGFEYLPFNAGPRICPGQQFAITETAYTTIRLCQAFSHIEARGHHPGRPWTESLTLTCCVGQGVHVAVMRRE